jgi:hypothetical protein
VARGDDLRDGPSMTVADHKKGIMPAERIR